MLSRLSDRIYRTLFANDNAADCAGISDAACAIESRSFFWNLANGACSKLAEKLAGPEIVLPLLMTLVGIPAYYVGLLMPVRQAGSLLPQLIAGGGIRRFAIRKWFWSASAAVQAIAIAAILYICLQSRAAELGFAVVAAVLCFSLASGVASISFKEVLAKTIPRGRRGRLLAARATVGGALALSAGAALQWYYLPASQQDAAGALAFAWLLGPAVALWLAAALFFAWIPEESGSTSESDDMLADVLASLHLLREHDFLIFLATRGLLLAVPLAMPFFAILALDPAGGGDGNGGSGETAIFRSGALMIAMAGSEILSSTFWGRLADRSSRLAMSAGGLLFTLCCFAPLIGSNFAPQEIAGPDSPGWWRWLAAGIDREFYYTLVFFALGVSYAGVRLGRKTYIVDAAPPEYRSLFVALGNSVIGVLTLVWGASSVFLEVLAPGWIIPALGGLGLIGAWIALIWLPRPDSFCRHLK
ncbi:MAG: MFS transporter [bacterium]|nr:MFS transporter [bacterium]